MAAASSPACPLGIVVDGSQTDSKSTTRRDRPQSGLQTPGKELGLNDFT